MLKKIFSLIVLITAFSFVGYMKAMQESGFETQLIERRPIGKKINKTLNKCDQCCALISFHCSHLTYFQEYKHAEITNKNLKKYRELLHQLIHMGINIRPIVSAINNDFVSKVKSKDLNCFITLNDINVLLALIKQTINKNVLPNEFASEEEINSIVKTIHYAFSNDFNSLKKILANYNLLRLDYIMDGFNVTFLMELVRMETDIELFNFIINNEKDKKYDWKKLFSISNYPTGWTVLHYCAFHMRKNIYPIILELMKEKNILNDVINIQDVYGYTSLMVAARHSNYEMVELLIHYGANVDFRCSDKFTALDHVEWHRIVYWFLLNNEDMSKLLQCRKLLRAKNNQIRKESCCFM